jgi:hypothetical protein
VNGRGVILRTALRQRTLNRIESDFPHLVGELEIGRLAAALGSDLNVVAPYVVLERPGVLTANYFVDARDDTDSFMTELGHYIAGLPREFVHWRALELLRSGVKHTPDLRREGFNFNLDLLSADGRSQISSVVSSRDNFDWSALRLVSPRGSADERK